MNTDVTYYYHQSAVLERILEFCGVPSGCLSTLSSVDPFASLSDSAELKELLKSATSEYISAYGHRLVELSRKNHCSTKTFNLGWVLDNALDVHRSIWDRENVVSTLDVEYFSKVFPGEPYLNPERTFRLMESVYRCVVDVLGSYGISPLVVTTGQGYNFDMIVSKSSAVFNDLVALGTVEPTLRHVYETPSARRGRPVPEEDARAFDTVGKLMEYVCHKVFCRLYTDPTRSLPLVIGDIVCDNERREAVSMDLSLYIHPLHKRSVRCPFSTYSKHMLRKDILCESVTHNVGYFFCIPRRSHNMELSLLEALNARKNSEEAVQLAKSIVSSVSDQSDGFDSLIREYKQSALYAFHQEYDAVEQDDPSEWANGYDRFDLHSIPPCVAQALRYPNPLLLQPTNLRALVRVLTASGWHPKHIAGLIYSKYKRDFGWEVDFMRYDANRWANVWVRIYAGMVVCDADDLSDLNCLSQQQKGETWMGMHHCPSANCGLDLADYRCLLQFKN